MAKFTLCGRLVTHTGRPRFTMKFTPRADGGWDGQLVGGPLVADGDIDPAKLAQLARQAGDFFTANLRRDWLQQAVADRAAELGLTAYALAARTGGAVSEGHIRAYLGCQKSMGSHKLQHVLRALDLTLQ